jgi:hypothetical protein
MGSANARSKSFPIRSPKIVDHHHHYPRATTPLLQQIQPPNCNHMHSTVSTRLYGRPHHPSIQYYMVECIYHRCECTIQMRLLYDTVWSNASTIYANGRSNAPIIQFYTVDAPTMYVIVWSNAPIIWYYLVECIYHVCECMIKCTYNTILYGRMHLSYATIQANASIYMRLHG